MKTILTTIFAIAVMVFAFNANPVMARGEKEKVCKEWEFRANGYVRVCKEWRWVSNEVDELRDPDQAGNERDVADSGNEGSTSAAQESDY